MPPKSDDDARTDEMFQVFGPARHGYVGGIEIDLRHPSIDPVEWEMPPLAPNFDFAVDLTWSPYIWFPWFGEFSAEKFASKGEQSLAAIRTIPVRTRKTDELSKMSVTEFLTAHSPIYFVNYGDKITVSRVDIIATERRMEHEHDTCVKHVFLQIVRKTGEVDSIDVPLIANGRLSMLLDSQDKHYFVRVLDRIMNHFELKSYSELSELAVDGPIAKQAVLVSSQLHNLLADPLRVCYHQKFKAKSRKEYEQMRSVLDLVDLSVLLGFAWAKAEAEVDLKPLAATALRRKSFNIKGGKRSGEARRKIAQEGWMKTARMLAFEIRAKQPNISQDRLTQAIDTAWGSKKPVAPEFPTLKKYISYLEKNEGLPPKPRKLSRVSALTAVE